MGYYEDLWSARELAISSTTPQKTGRFTAIVDIDADDDFLLDSPHQFTLEAENYDTLKKNLIDKLNGFKFKRVGSWSMTDKDGNKKGGSYDWRWYDIRDRAIEELKENNMEISLGGNQTINIDIHEIQPELIENKRNRKKR